ncbi:uncharacterized protein LOC133724894 isoform X2 [Rosa rugosa]|uniref:uncharacterized protein LOC133724894 isoform X2 n=1 Tax=Rosa rugosa TaxID=74645 RepID=UPI002B410CC9|nr:uncharacterized protein LOC133724894 isoform X2 [Rosa rugosa]
MLTEESGASRCWIRQCQGLRLATCIQDSGVREIKPKSSTIMGSSAQVRFQPRIGQFTDAESDRQTHSLQGNPQNCTLFVGIQMWLRSVKSVRVWSLVL